MSHYHPDDFEHLKDNKMNTQIDRCLSLYLKFTKEKPDESCQVITPFKGEYIILDFDVNNGGEFYKWNEDSGVMQKALEPKLFAVLPTVFGSY